MKNLRTLAPFSVFFMLFSNGFTAQSASPGTVPPIPRAAPETGVQFLVGEHTASRVGLTADMNWSDLTPAADRWLDVAGMGAVRARNEKGRESAYIRTAQLSGRQRDTTHDKVALILLGLAAHAAVTWDAQSTNHFFHHYPAGFRPRELDPLVRPFAGNALMYPMANLLFAAPVDLLLFKTRHSQKPVRMLTYAAASAVGGDRNTPVHGEYGERAHQERQVAEALWRSDLS